MLQTHVNGTIGADCHGHAQNIGRLFRSDAHGNDFIGLSGFFQLHGCFHGDLIKGIDAHFQSRKFDVLTVGLRVHLHVVVDNAFDCHKYFHHENSS